METIIFRGKRIRGGEWVYGNYFYDKDLPPYAPMICIYENEAIDMYAVSPSTVGQFTGLYDMHGKPIFEGDVCLCDRNINDHIDKKTFAIKFSPLDGWYGASKDGWSEFSGSAFECAEVIGNMYDHPDWLTEK